VGVFAQHCVEALQLDCTALEHLTGEYGVLGKGGRRWRRREVGGRRDGGRSQVQDRRDRCR
jgi:hypothetical protein